VKGNIPAFTENYSLLNYVGKDENKNLIKIAKYLEEFKDKYKEFSLFLWGTPGTQKSTILRYMGCNLIARGFTVIYMLADTLIKELIESDRDPLLKFKWYTKYMNYDCIIIDEFSEDKITTYESGWQRKFILPFLKMRMEIKRKAILFGSNNHPDNIGIYFDGAIQDLVSREIKDKTMEFKDEYMALVKEFNSSDITIDMWG
jgi:DNA replication protein DnaC